MTRLSVAVVVATVAFIAYSRTLLPGVDLGDTGAFQAAVLWPKISARQAYPLYFGLAGPFVAAVSPGNPARGLNLFSALWGGAAAGLLTWVVATVSRSSLAGAIGGLLLAFSYTFWTQAVIAEVYTLHLALIGATLVALQAYGTRPSTARLALACAVYATAFGNHLSMILLLPSCAAFVTMSRPRPRDLLRPSTIAMATAIAGAASLIYLPNLLAMLSSIDAPASLAGRLASFWFDVTKVDWRTSMVLGVVPADDRLAMWAWDAQQQFGVLGVLAAIAGVVRLWWIAKPWAVLVVSAYAATATFALTYNVGDAHVFFLPSHFFAAAAAGMLFAPPLSAPAPDGSIRPSSSRGPRAALAGLALAMLAYVAWRGADTWPAADRHRDTRGEALATRLLAGVNERNGLFVSDMNWEIENVLLYAGRNQHRDVAWVRAVEVMPHLPFLVADNHAIGRDVVLSQGAAATVVAAYGSAFPILPDEMPAPMSLTDTVAGIPSGTPYVITVLEPLREYRLDTGDLERALAVLGGTRVTRSPGRYEVIAGVAGSKPSYYRASQRPFGGRASLLGDELTIRMDAWLPSDTFRRGGFGHVLRGREPLMFIERGVSLLWLGRDGQPTVAYAAGPYATQSRYRIPAGGTRLARGGSVEPDRRLARTPAGGPWQP